MPSLLELEVRQIDIEKRFKEVGGMPTDDVTQEIDTANLRVAGGTHPERYADTGVETVRKYADPVGNPYQRRARLPQPD